MTPGNLAWRELERGRAAAANDVIWPEPDPALDTDFRDDGEVALPPESARAARLKGGELDAQMSIELIRRIVAHDERALESLYDLAAGRVYGLVLRITQCAAMAEEVVEETFWQVWRQAPRFDPTRGRPMTWLLAMARSRAIDALRRDERFAHDPWPDDDLVDAGQRHFGIDGPATAPDQLQAARDDGALHAALARLDARARQLVSLAFFRGLTHEEIAARQGMPLGSVKSLIRRALQQLRRDLAPTTGHPR